MSQLEMFAAPEVLATVGTSRRVEWVPPEFTPFPDALRRRLEIDLRHLQSAEVRPWPAERVGDEIDSFLGCVERLPPEHRGDLETRFRTELSRLGLEG